jgi:gluconate 2-dehydrogenase gamma chain
MKRREFLMVPVAAMGVAAILQRERLDLPIQSGKVRMPLRFFTEEEAHVVAAACERIFPMDASGPGATDAGVVVYIDRQLAGPYGSDKYRYTKPPFIESIPEHGYQGRATPRQIYRDGIRGLGDFAKRSAAEQDASLRAIESSRFFTLLYGHTIEGMFSDPVHGGNASLIGWAMIGYPGPRMSYRDEIDKYHGRPFRPKPVGLQQIVGRAARPWEDEPS